MERALLDEMVCPYCNGYFRVAREVETADGRLNYALIECRCFKFPIVEGILLLSLAKGYGGAEEELQPYVPLQVAAIELLERGDVQTLRAWIRRHIPLAADIMSGSAGSYVQFCSKMAGQMESARTSYLIRQGRYESVGFPRRTRFNALTEGAPKARPELGRYLAHVEAARQLYRFCRMRLRPAQYGLEQLANFYAWRFFAPRTNALAMQLQSLPMEGRVLSLCCGQGVFENLITARAPSCNIISVDGQFLNLLATKRYVNPTGAYICHDLQMPLPFRDGYFDAVFSSTCLPEIPTQRSFVTESIRVTRDIGWTLFDSIWGVRIEQRIDRFRDYRFAQNIFLQLSEYSRLFSECTPAGRDVTVSIPAAPDAYMKAPGWISGKDRIEAAIQQSADPMLSMLIIAPDRIPDAQSIIRPPWLAPEKLCVSPVFSVKQTSRRELVLESRPWLAHPPPQHAPLAFEGYPATEVLKIDDLKDPEFLLQAFCRGLLALLPREFGDEPRRLSAFL